MGNREWKSNDGRLFTIPHSPFPIPYSLFPIPGFQSPSASRMNSGWARAALWISAL
jgi:hypothetical protein